MKKIILATTILVAFAITSFGKRVDPILLNDLTTAVRNKCDVQWTKTDNYTRAAFHYRGKEVYAFYDIADEALIGFSIPLVAGDFPPSFARVMKQKYAGWSIVEAIMFVDAK